MIDSSKWSVIEAGLRCVQGKGGCEFDQPQGRAKKQFIRTGPKLYPATYGAAVIIMAFDEKGQADNDRCARSSICERSYKDPDRERSASIRQTLFSIRTYFAVATGIEEHATSYGHRTSLKATRQIKEKLPHAMVSGGVSNVSFSFRGNNVVREAIHSVFLYHAIRAGMDMGIVNAGQLAIS